MYERLDWGFNILPNNVHSSSLILTLDIFPSQSAPFVMKLEAASSSEIKVIKSYYFSLMVLKWKWDDYKFISSYFCSVALENYGLGLV